MIVLWASILAWATAMYNARKSTWRILTGKGRDHDALKWGVFLFGALTIGYSARGIFIPNDQSTLFALRCSSIVLALYATTILRFYKG